MFILERVIIAKKIKSVSILLNMKLKYLGSRNLRKKH